MDYTKHMMHACAHIIIILVTVRKVFFYSIIVLYYYIQHSPMKAEPAS